jgi:hypothetical protein
VRVILRSCVAVLLVYGLIYLADLFVSIPFKKHRLNLGVGPHDVFPPLTTRRFRPGDRVCVGPGAEGRAWRPGTVVHVKDDAASDDGPAYVVALAADGAAADGARPLKAEAVCAALSLKYEHPPPHPL